MPHGIASFLPEVHLLTNRQGAGPDDSAEAFVHRRRADRIASFHCGALCLILARRRLIVMSRFGRDQGGSARDADIRFWARLTQPDMGEQILL
jgi:hypothetical protein